MDGPTGHIAPDIGLNPPGFDPEPQMRDFPDFKSFKDASEAWNYRNVSEEQMREIERQLEERNRILEENARLDAERQQLLEEEEVIEEEVAGEEALVESEEIVEAIEDEIPFGFVLGALTAAVIAATLIKMGFDQAEAAAIKEKINELPPNSHFPDLPHPGGFDPQHPPTLTPKYSNTPFHFLVSGRKRRRKFPFA